MKVFQMKCRGRPIAYLILGWLPPILWGGIIFYLSSRPASAFPSLWFPQQDKIAHIIEYGIFAILIFRAIFLPTYHWIPISRLRRATIIILIATALYGASDEVHQIFVPTRTGSVTDWLADVTGACLAVAFCLYFARRKPEAK